MEEQLAATLRQLQDGLARAEAAAQAADLRAAAAEQRAAAAEQRAAAVEGQAGSAAAAAASAAGAAAHAAQGAAEAARDASPHRGGQRPNGFGMGGGLGGSFFPGGLVDTRLLNKPGEYSGPSQWAAWSFQFRNWLGVVDAEMKDKLITAQGLSEEDVANDGLGDDMLQRSRGLYMILASLCRGAAATKVENSGDGEGFVAWQRLYREANPGTSGHHAARMQELLAARFRREHLAADFDAFDLLAARYETETRQVLPDSLRNAVVTRGLDDASLRQHLLLNAGRLESYTALRSELLAVQLAQRGAAAMAQSSSAPSGGQAPMDVDSVVAAVLARVGKGKGFKGKDGKGKDGKGKHKDGKGKHKDGTTKGGKDGGKQKAKDGKGSGERRCFRCDQPGHYKRDCPQRVAAIEGGGDPTYDGAAAEQEPMKINVASVQEGSPGPVFIMAARGAEDANSDDIMIDSGAARSTCPPGFGGQGACLREPARVLNLRSATNAPIKHLGDATVPLRTSCGRELLADFAVSEVTHPILSVAGLVDKGFTVTFGPDRAAVSRSGVEELSLVRRGGLYWLPARPSPSAAASATRVCVARPVVSATAAAEAGEEQAADTDDEPLRAGTGEYEEPRDTGGAASSGHTDAAAAQQPAQQRRGRVRGGTSSEDAVLQSAGWRGPAAIGPPSAPVPKAASVPAAPSAAARAQHELTHIPAQPWCQVCVESKAADMPHRPRQAGGDIPELQIDYTFWPDVAGGTVAIAVLCWPRVGAVYAATCAKGPGDYVVGCLATALELWGLQGAITLRSDQEPAVLALVSAVLAKRGGEGGQPEATPSRSSQSLGGAERYNQAVSSQLRSLLLQLQRRVCAEIHVGLNAFPWAVRHAAWLLTRFVVKEHGSTAWALLRGRPFAGDVAEFGETVLGRLPGATAADRKDEARWVEGVWLGKTEVSDEHLLGTRAGIQRVRCVRRRPAAEAFSKALVLSFKGVPWNLAAAPGSGRARGDSGKPEEEPRADSNLRSRMAGGTLENEGAATAPAAAPTLRQIEVEAGPLAGRLPYVTRALLERHGRTLGCGRCGGDLTVAHSPACRARFANIAAAAGAAAAAAGEPSAAAGAAGRRAGAADREESPGKKARLQAPAASAGAASSAASGAGGAPPPPGAQEAPDEDMDDEGPQGKRLRLAVVRSILAEDAGQQPATESDFGNLVAAVAADGREEERGREQGSFRYVHGPVWCSRSGRELAADRVEKARALEMRQMAAKGVVREVPRSSLPPGARLLKTRWVDDERFGDAARGDFVRSRCVSMEFRSYDGVRDDTYAGTPPLWVLRFVVSFCASQPRGKRMHLGTADISVAFFHAQMDEEIFAEAPRGCCSEGSVWQVLRAMYGTRKAAKLWARYVRDFMVKEGWSAVRPVPGLFWHRALDAVCEVHGDDFLYAAPLPNHAAIDQQIRRHADAKILGKVGPEIAGGTASFLKRGLGYDSAGDVFTIVPNRKNVADVVRACGLDAASARPADTPGTKATGSSLRDADVALDGDAGRAFLSIGGGLVYVSLDRPDLQFTAKTVMAQASAPTRLTEARLKRAVRFLAGAPVLLWSFPRQPWPAVVDITVDSDWGGSGPDGRRSTTGMVVRFGRHVLETASVTQSTIALSSGEAECIAMVRGAAAGVNIKAVLNEMSFDVGVKLHTDSRAAKGMAMKSGLSNKTRHMSIKVCWLQELVEAKVISLATVRSEDNVADILTKWLPLAALTRHLKEMGLSWLRT